MALRFVVAANAEHPPLVEESGWSWRRRIPLDATYKSEDWPRFIEEEARVRSELRWQAFKHRLAQSVRKFSLKRTPQLQRKNIFCPLCIGWALSADLANLRPLDHMTLSGI
jgi:hypothetical protein